MKTSTMHLDKTKNQKGIRQGDYCCPSYLGTCFQMSNVSIEKIGESINLGRTTASSKIRGWRCDLCKYQRRAHRNVAGYKVCFEYGWIRVKYWDTQIFDQLRRRKNDHKLENRNIENVDQKNNDMKAQSRKWCGKVVKWKPFTEKRGAGQTQKWRR